MRILPCGPRALLLEFDDAARRRAWAAELRARPPQGVTDVIPAAVTVLLICPGGVARVCADLLRRSRPEPAEPDATAGLLEVPVCYDGPDLAEVAAHVDRSGAELIAWHSEQIWTVDFTGFLPGFGYLTAADALTIPRRATPRPRLPAGTVGLAGEWSGIYPQTGPGGWQCIGRTDLRTFDLRREPAAELFPGRQVRFDPVREVGTIDLAPAPSQAADTNASTSSTPGGIPARPSQPGDTPILTVASVTGQVLVQDLGRTGAADLGLGVGGAMDRGALRLANRLVGNPETAAGLEILGAVTLRADQPTRCAVTGAPGALLVDDRPAPHHTPIQVPAGAHLTLRAPSVGVRSYLACGGGIDAELVAGSRGSSATVGVGRPALTAGDTLVSVDAPGSWPATGPVPGLEAAVELTGQWGPRADWFTAAARARLVGESWQVDAASDRVGIRLAGSDLPRHRTGELASEGVVRGSMQVSPSGPVVFAADHPITGGYPVIAVLDDAAVDRLSQVRPGDSVRFRLRAAH